MGAHLHFDCFSGISGDMILGALVSAGLPVDQLSHALKGLPLSGYKLRCEKVLRNGLEASKVDVLIHKGLRESTSLLQILRLIERSRLPQPVKERSQEVFKRLARVEGAVHGVSPERVHFHEVGTVDSLVDVVGCVLGCHLLGVSRVSASAVNLGSGSVDTAHGRLPVPAPAVSNLSQGIPVYSEGPDRELTTPTGLALLTTLSTEFGSLPLMRPLTIGYGAGSADTQGWPNVLRVFLGESSIGGEFSADVVVKIETNLDDLNPQVYESVIDRMLGGGALDVTLTPVVMKRGRPGIVLTALTSREKADTVASVILRETTALGVRMQEMSRRVLPRQVQSVRILAGDVRVKIAEVEPGMTKAAPEYSDCRRIADQTGRPVREIMNEAVRAFHSATTPGKKESVKRKSGRKGNRH